MTSKDGFSRRQFVAGAGAAAAGVFLGPSARGQASQVAMPAASLDALRKVCRGTVVEADEPQFADRVYGGLWNRLVPERAPQIVVCAADEQDVISGDKIPIFTGPNVPAPLPNAALSLSARVYGGPWTMWKDGPMTKLIPDDIRNVWRS